jgi:hypothetical protein
MEDKDGYLYKRMEDFESDYEIDEEGKGKGKPKLHWIHTIVFIIKKEKKKIK